jgi:hypothetical protein
MSIEDTIRREYERWMDVAGNDGDGEEGAVPAEGQARWTGCCMASGRERGLHGFRTRACRVDPGRICKNCPIRPERPARFTLLTTPAAREQILQVAGC